MERERLHYEQLVQLEPLNGIHLQRVEHQLQQVPVSQRQVFQQRLLIMYRVKQMLLVNQQERQ